MQKLYHLIVVGALVLLFVLLMSEFNLLFILHHIQFADHSQIDKVRANETKTRDTKRNQRFRPSFNTEKKTTMDLH